jgi:phage-related protein
MSTFTYIPTYSANVSKQPKVASTKFGDGYEQSVPLGINTQARKWSLTFAREYVNIGAIDTFLTTLNGVDSFDWIPPTGLTGKWICKSWSRSKESYNFDTLVAVFEEVFGE